MGGEEEDLSRGELTVLTVHFVQKETGEGRSRGDRDLTPLSLSLSLSHSRLLYPIHFYDPAKVRCASVVRLLRK